MLSLINRLLDVSKIEAGKLERKNSVFSLSGMLDKFTESYGERARLKGLEFFSLVDKNLPRYISGDDDRLIEVLTNLIGNAIKFTKQGSISFSAQRIGTTEGEPRLRFEK